jgi:hypothetical protein
MHFKYSSFLFHTGANCDAHNCLSVAVHGSVVQTSAIPYFEVAHHRFLFFASFRAALGFPVSANKNERAENIDS